MSSLLLLCSTDGLAICLFQRHGSLHLGSYLATTDPAASEQAGRRLDIDQSQRLGLAKPVPMSITFGWPRSHSRRVFSILPLPFVTPRFPHLRFPIPV
jgi:hypothetical protein